jgi:hypothetical protein
LRRGDSLNRFKFFSSLTDSPPFSIGYAGAFAIEKANDLRDLKQIGF